MTTEQKFIGSGALLTIAIIVGGAFFFSRGNTSTIPEDQIASKQGLHWHPTLIVTVDGKKQEIPPNLGIGGATHGKIHTHDTDNKKGVVHIEAQGIVTKDDITLGKFFNLWGKEFSSNKLFDKTNGPDGKVTMLVNGEANKDFENYIMKDGVNIEIKYE